jgi:hypothetical protein
MISSKNLLRLYWKEPSKPKNPSKPDQVCPFSSLQIPKSHETHQAQESKHPTLSPTAFQIAHLFPPVPGFLYAGTDAGVPNQLS